MYDLSILIPARNEMFLSLTVESILKNIRGNTEIIVVLDGAWADPPIVDDKRVSIIYNAKAVGQRAATNQACKLSKAKYVMKIDAHCTVDEGFDVKLMADMQDDWTVVPAMYNLHGFDWVCISCPHRQYQGPTPKECPKCKGKMKREIIWKPRLSRKSLFYRFDKTLHFQYWGDLSKRTESNGDIAETLSIQGSCFMLTRKKYWELDICEEKFGSWGQQGTEVACKTWLSGGRVVVNKKTWYSHMFRTQGGDFGFPYPQSNSQVNHAREYSRELFLRNKWKGAKKSFEWLIEKFAPIPDWHTTEYKTPTKGIIYYTRNKVNFKLGHKCRKQILKAKLPIVSISSKKMDFGQNFVYNLDGSYLEMFKKILIGLKQINTDVVYFCEDDVLYHQSHFDFTPLKKDIFYYDKNVWRIRSIDGFALHYDAKQLNMICGYRDFLIKHYEKRIALVEKNGFSMKMGFEPGTHNRKERVDDYTSEYYSSYYPSLDIRHTTNLTANRWKKSQFRNKNSCLNWKESYLTEIDGWNFKNNTFENLLSSL